MVAFSAVVESGRQNQKINSFRDSFMSNGRNYNSGGTPYQSSKSKRSGNKKSTKWIWITLAIVFSSMFLFCIVGVIGVIFLGLGMVAADVEVEVRDRPAIRENIGEIEEFNINYSKTAAHEDDEVFVFDVEGTKGDGEVTAKIETNINGEEEIIWAELRTSAGDTIAIE